MRRGAGPRGAFRLPFVAARSPAVSVSVCVDRADRARLCFPPGSGPFFGGASMTLGLVQLTTALTNPPKPRKTQAKPHKNEWPFAHISSSGAFHPAPESIRHPPPFSRFVRSMPFSSFERPSCAQRFLRHSRPSARPNSNYWSISLLGDPGRSPVPPQQPSR